MHRQSIGSPASKLPIEESPKPTATSSLDIDEDNDKSLKIQKPSPKPERFLHVIPLLTALCFLILYLSSHNPTQTDLAEFSEFNWPLHTQDTKDIHGLERFLEVERSEILGIRSLKNLQERETRDFKYRSHRKMPISSS